MACSRVCRSVSRDCAQRRANARRRLTVAPARTAPTSPHGRVVELAAEPVGEREAVDGDAVVGRRRAPCARPRRRARTRRRGSAAARTVGADDVHAVCHGSASLSNADARRPRRLGRRTCVRAPAPIAVASSSASVGRTAARRVNVSTTAPSAHVATMAPRCRARTRRARRRRRASRPGRSRRRRRRSSGPACRPG